MSLLVGLLLSVSASADVSDQPAAHRDVFRPSAADWCPEGTAREAAEDCVVPPVLISSIPPAYPEAARRARFAGKVELEVVVGEFGDVEEVRVLKRNPVFEAAAVEAVRERRYEPAYRRGIPVATCFPITVRFGLESSRERPIGPSPVGDEVIQVAMDDGQSDVEVAGRNRKKRPEPPNRDRGLH